MAEVTNNEAKNNEENKPMMLDGREVKNIRIYCSKHGDISNGSVYLRYTTILEKDKKTIVNNNNIMCMCCLNEYYLKASAEPKVIETVTYKKDENGELVLDENGDPIREVKSRYIYQKDENGNLIKDKDGNPIPEKLLGEVSVDVEYADPEKKEESNK